MSRPHDAPHFGVLFTEGTNCHRETAFALEVSGAVASVVHINELRDGTRNFADYQGVVIPGGFSYGDDVASGKIFANELTEYFTDQILEFVNAGKPVLGVCNGDQVLVKSGLLPDLTPGRQSVTLTDNQSGRFECRYVDLMVEDSACQFAQPADFSEVPIPMQSAHGEGRLVARPEVIERLWSDGLVVFTYANPDGAPADGDPQNPSGSTDNIAGICDHSGLILGMMPHPERNVGAFHPDLRRTAAARNAASVIFGNLVRYARDAA